jgi:hypothetical protein
MLASMSSRRTSPGRPAHAAFAAYAYFDFYRVTTPADRAR